MILKNKRVTVLGLGKSGRAAAEFLIGKGARVRATDGSQKPPVLKAAARLKALGAEVETGGHSEAFLTGTDLFITSPGLSKQSLPLVYARRKKIPVLSEIELASYFCAGTIVAVTGSNGKTTTSHLIHRILLGAGRKSVLCGNVGTAFLGSLKKIDSSTIVVLELSSFQLEDSPTFRPFIAVVTNIFPNHLDRHGTLRRYVAAKKKIFKNQTEKDLLVLNHDDRCVRAMARQARARVVFFSKRRLRGGVWLTEDAVNAKIKGFPQNRFARGRLRLSGDHNLENIMAAVAVGTVFKLPSGEVQKALDGFKTLEHRIEPLGSVDGIRFVNDSKSTTVGSTRAAILACPGTLVLIAGGRDKGAPFAEIEDLLRKKARRVVLYGEAREKIRKSFRAYDRVYLAEKFEQAVKLAFRQARPGETILLSPMCTSFDQFNSFEQRGECFKRIVKALRGRTGAANPGQRSPGQSGSR